MKRKEFLESGVIGAITLMVPDPLFRRFHQKSMTDNLESKFQNSPDVAKPHTWWHWMNGNVSKEGIRLDLEAMKEAGLGGFQMFDVTDHIPQGPVNYGSDEWHEMMNYTFEKAEELGLEVCFHNCAGWSSSGGPWITPEKSMKTVVWSQQQVQSSISEFSTRLPEPEAKQDYYRDIAVLAFPTPKGEINADSNKGFRLKNWQAKAGFERKDHLQQDTREISSDRLISLDQIIDLSNKIDNNDRLVWKVPKGNWTILRFGYTTTGRTNRMAPPEGRGLECDKLSKQAVEAHWNEIVKRVIGDAGPRTVNTLYSILIDSFEVGAQNWTQQFAQEFEQRHGYDLLYYLPCLTGRVVESIEISERFLWDFRRTIADLFSENYYGHFVELCEQNGMKLSVEPYGNDGNFDNFALAARSEIPMGEFWVNRYGFYWATSKLASSAAHAYGRKYAASETFTAGGKEAAWKNDPYSLKTMGDYFYCKGINRFIFHEFAHHPWPNLKPGMTMGPHGFQMNRGNTWFKQASAWLTYLTRCQYLLQEGQFVADICYYFGENAPNTLVSREELQPTPPEGYDYDAFAIDVLMQLEVENGWLLLPSGMQYRVLVLPHFEQTMRPEVLRKVYDLVRDGATIVGPKPIRSPSLANYPQCDGLIQRMTDQVWGDVDGRHVTKNGFGKGCVYWGQPLKQVLTDLNIQPDFSYSGEDSPNLRYIHRLIDGKDVYFVSNQTYQYVTVECVFRAIGTPQLWDPDTGDTKTAFLFRQKKGKTTIPMFMEPAESLFVVFENKQHNYNSTVEATYQNRNISELNIQGQNDLKIIEAKYGVLDNISQTIDVRRDVSARVKKGQLDIIPYRHITGNPIPEIEEKDKQLYIKYFLDGNIKTKTVDFAARAIIPEQPAGLTLPFASLYSKKAGIACLKAWKSGIYQLRLARGQTQKIHVGEVLPPIDLAGPWTVRFPKGWGAPQEVTFNRLISWTEHPHTDIKHFSGTATYEKELNIPRRRLGEEQVLYLDLGRVKNIAEVILNGENLGICWKSPYRVDISRAAKPGKNTLQIQVTNLWPNRLIGDAGKPDLRPFNKFGWRGASPKGWDVWIDLAEQEQRYDLYSRETGRYTWATWKHYDKEDSLLESGLIGEVRLLTAIKKEILI